MRLLHVHTLELNEFRDEANVPEYVVASHRWLENETTYQDVKNGCNQDGAGYKKVIAFAKYVKDNIPPVKWLWIDTCCIDKTNSAELQYCITSMFRWYRNAKLCVAHLVNVTTGDDLSQFAQDEWFRRGWTLQELLAPQMVLFVNKDWHVIGHKGCTVQRYDTLFLGPDLGANIATITSIPLEVLNDWAKSINVRREDKINWMERRRTTCPEDRWYALFGIVGVSMPVMYGEGDIDARNRLLAALHDRDVSTKQYKDVSARESQEYREIVKWLAPPDPWMNHVAARRLHERHTGTWLLESTQYQAWKAGKTQCLWLHGGPGCGKTVLCSTLIENMRAVCSRESNVGHAVFYFSFTDERKQNTKDFLISLLAQLGRKEPGFSILGEMATHPTKRRPGQDELRNILRTNLLSYDRVYCHLDALDECPEAADTRQDVLREVEDLLEQAPNLSILVTSRDTFDIRQLMTQVNATSVSLTSDSVSPDIRRYVATQLARSPKLSRLDAATKLLVETTLSQKAGGMFRWVFCQLQELKKSKSTRSDSVKRILLALPDTLDQTYERMLESISADDRPFALRLLRWLAYSERPLSLEELSEASIIDPGDHTQPDGAVNIENRGGWSDSLEILAGLVTAEESHTISDVPATIMREQNYIEECSASGVDLAAYEDETWLDQNVSKSSIVRLAHFSVKEYLESSRIGNSASKTYHLRPAREHRYLTQSCLLYLEHYSASPRKTLSVRDLVAFPLLYYVSTSWYMHAQSQESGDSRAELRFLTSDDCLHDWSCVHKIEAPYLTHFGANDAKTGSGLLYSTIAGLSVFNELIEMGQDVNTRGGYYNSTALYEASARNNKDSVTTLLSAGADPNGKGGIASYTALFAASSYGYETIVRMLLESGADINAQGGLSGQTVLHAALANGHSKTAELLIEAGADVNAEDWNGETVLITACSRPFMEGQERVVQALLDAGADVNPHDYDGQTALVAAFEMSFSNERTEVVHMLLDAGAEVKAQDERLTECLFMAEQNSFHQKTLERISGDYTKGGAINTSIGML